MFLRDFALSGAFTLSFLSAAWQIETPQVCGQFRHFIFESPTNQFSPEVCVTKSRSFELSRLEELEFRLESLLDLQRRQTFFLTHLESNGFVQARSQMINHAVWGALKESSEDLQSLIRDFLSGDRPGNWVRALWIDALMRQDLEGQAQTLKQLRKQSNLNLNPGQDWLVVRQDIERKTGIRPSDLPIAQMAIKNGRAEFKVQIGSEEYAVLKPPPARWIVLREEMPTGNIRSWIDQLQRNRRVLWIFSESAKKTDLGPLQNDDLELLAHMNPGLRFVALNGTALAGLSRMPELLRGAGIHRLRKSTGLETGIPNGYFPIFRYVHAQGQEINRVVAALEKPVIL